VDAHLAAELEGVLDLAAGDVLLEAQQALFGALLDAELRCSPDHSC
jgi:hypothetical protein